MILTTKLFKRPKMGEYEEDIKNFGFAESAKHLILKQIRGEVK
tara:strand:+ start:1140 stop:1268 length:129 start_codon:yes stop_codon:yes gene_type:complete